MTAPALDHVDVWVFDLDNTLYPERCNLFKQVERRIGEYVARVVGVGLEEARRLQKEHFRQYGTTMNGLMIEHGIDPRHFLGYVHDIDYAPIGPDPALAAALERLPGPKFIFTNASDAHAEAVLDRIGIRGHFDGIHDIIASGYAPKPKDTFYDGFLARFGVAPRNAALFEDMAKNLAPAHARGMTTVLIETDNPYCMEGHDGQHVQHRTRDIAAWLGGVAAARGR